MLTPRPPGCGIFSHSPERSICAAAGRAAAVISTRRNAVLNPWRMVDRYFLQLTGLVHHRPDAVDVAVADGTRLVGRDALGEAEAAATAAASRIGRAERGLLSRRRQIREVHDPDGLFVVGHAG